jgi:ABC-type multidrug transport system fused ATPase/permease subunit
MSREADELVFAAPRIIDYLKAMRETSRVLVWIFRDVIGMKVLRSAWPLPAWAIAESLLRMLRPLVAALVLNSLVTGQTSALWWQIGLFVMLHLAAKVADFGMEHCREWLFGDAFGRVYRQSNERFFAKSLGQHAAESGRFSASNVERGFHRCLDLIFMTMAALPLVIETVVVCALVWTLTPLLGFISLVMLLNHALWTLYLNRRVNVDATVTERGWCDLNRCRSERWDNVERVLASGMAAREVENMDRQYGEVIAADRRLWLWVIRNALLRSITTAAIFLAAFGLGVQAVVFGQLSVGMLFPLLLWLTLINTQLDQLGRLERQLSWIAMAVRPMMDALAVPSDVTERPDSLSLLSSESLRIEFEDVWFGFAEDGSMGPYVLKGVSFTVEPGEKVGLVGPSGAGKSTIIKLMLRASDPKRGRILVNGVDLRDLSLDSYRRLIGYIPQSPAVIDGTVRYNLSFGSEAEIPDDDLWRVVQDLQLDLGGRLSGTTVSDKLGTRVGRRGLKLSGGQGQRLMIGAAIAAGPRLLLADEPTSALDSTTELAVNDGLARCLNGHAGSVVIAHRLSTLAACTKIIVLSDGRVEAVASSLAEARTVSPTLRRLAEDQHLR